MVGPITESLILLTLILSPFLQNPYKVFSSADPLTESLLLETPFQSP